MRPLQKAEDVKEVELQMTWMDKGGHDWNCVLLKPTRAIRNIRSPVFSVSEFIEASVTLHYFAGKSHTQSPR